LPNEPKEGGSGAWAVRAGACRPAAPCDVRLTGRPGARAYGSGAGRALVFRSRRMRVALIYSPRTYPTANGSVPPCGLAHHARPAPSPRYQTGPGICNFFGGVRSFSGSSFAGVTFPPPPICANARHLSRRRGNGTEKVLTPPEKMQFPDPVWYLACAAARRPSIERIVIMRGLYETTLWQGARVGRPDGAGLPGQNAGARRRQSP
jgi:hypothetical protein